jgi:hypothetical protein
MYMITMEIQINQSIDVKHVSYKNIVYLKVYDTLYILNLQLNYNKK